MRGASLTGELQAMLARHRGVRDCALIDAGSDLIWHKEPLEESDDL